WPGTADYGNPGGNCKDRTQNEAHNRQDLERFRPESEDVMHGEADFSVDVLRLNHEQKRAGLFGRDDPEEFDIPVGREIDSSLDMWIHFDFHRQNSDPGFARLL